MHLPVLVSYGGISPAGRSSAHRAYQRLVYEKLSRQQQLEVCRDLAALTNRDSFSEADEQMLLDGTLIRCLDSEHYFDPDALPSHHALPEGSVQEIRLSAEHAKQEFPGWHRRVNEDGTVTLTPGDDAQQLRINRPQQLSCQCAGQFPSGFEPSRYYPSRSHPRALETTIFGMSDALGNMGLDWDSVHSQLAPERIAVISGSAISQIDSGVHNYITARLTGGRASSRALALGLGSMSADFINAYVLGTCGITGNYVGACATWLYNLNAACDLIRSGQVDLAVVGAAECQVNPWTIEGFAASNATATDQNLLQVQRELGEDASQPDHRAACRPFALNAGMVIGESAQFAILMSDELALELGARILGAPLCVYINADGYKRSISGPGMGNYLTVARALDCSAEILGEQIVSEQSVVLAHGTGTPQNRTTESHLLNTCAQAFGIQQWPVVAIKSRLGHSMGCSAGDQLFTAMGIFAHNLLPGTLNAPGPAPDVYNSHLNIRYQHEELTSGQTQLILINAKGFGGNNATAALCSRESTLQLLRDRHGQAAITAWQKKTEAAEQAAAEYDRCALQGDYNIRYHHGADVLDGTAGDVTVQRDSIRLKDYAVPIALRTKNPFGSKDSDKN